MRDKSKFYQLNAEDFQVKYLGKHPEYPNEQLYKVFEPSNSIIGFAKTETEAVRLIPYLCIW